MLNGITKQSQIRMPQRDKQEATQKSERHEKADPIRDQIELGSRVSEHSKARKTIAQQVLMRWLKEQENGGDPFGGAASLGEAIKKSADSLGFLDEMQSALDKHYNGDQNNVFGPLCITGCEVTPEDMGTMLRQAGINTFETSKEIAEKVWSAVRNTGEAVSDAVQDTVSSFLRDPNLSLEAKLMLLMAKLAEDLDEQIQEKMEKLDTESRKKESNGTDGTNNQSSNTQTLQTELEDLVQRRRQMFAAVQNMMKSLHETSMNAVRSLK